MGVALFLSNLAHKKLTASQLRDSYPKYFISKNRIDLSDTSVIEKIFEHLKAKYANEKITTIDGVKIDFEADRSWVILRKSNTEPIIRIYSEAPTKEAADQLAEKIIADAKSVM